MIFPMVLPRVEQPDDFASHRIDAGQIGPLVEVAVDAAQGKVLADVPCLPS